MTFNFQQVRENQSLDNNFLKNVTTVVNNIMRGKINARGDLTLTASSDTTVVEDSNVGGSSCVLLSPTSASAASEKASGNMYVSYTGKQTFTITHTNNSISDRSFRYVVLG